MDNIVIICVIQIKSIHMNRVQGVYFTTIQKIFSFPFRLNFSVKNGGVAWDFQLGGEVLKYIR